MFPSGAGVEVIENKGYMSTRVYLPWSFAVSNILPLVKTNRVFSADTMDNFQNKTRGLLGTFNFDYGDDFVLPDGSTVSLNINTNDFRSIHENFGMKCKNLI